MKLVKSLLLGSAAGLVAVAGAQAADLPVKAKPVEYVKICSLYGVGFYYIPGTDMCLKIGGWVRAEYAYGDNGSMTWGLGNGNVNNRSTNNSTLRARGYITADARNQTEYGTVRGYIAVGINTNDVGLNTAANQFSANRAFIQWAGFTFGLAQSFYDFYSVPATSYWGSFPASDTGDPGWMVARLHCAVRQRLVGDARCRRAPHDADHQRQRSLGHRVGCMARAVHSGGCAVVALRRWRLRRLPDA